jgi:ERCC4-type nuclease
VCRIVVDWWERQSGMPEALAALGVDVVVSHLDAADYDLGGGVLVERKTVVDLHLSLQRGRLWRQLDELRLAARLPYLLAEGVSLDIGSLSRRAVRGVCLAVMGLGIPVIRTDDVGDSALWLSVLARRRNGRRPRRDRPVYAQKLKPGRVPEAMLTAVPGISVRRARALLAEFGTISGVLAAGPAEWTRVDGIGVGVATALADAVS